MFICSDIMNNETGCYRYNVVTDDGCVCVWKPRGERLNPASAVKRHTAPCWCDHLGFLRIRYSVNPSSGTRDNFSSAICTGDHAAPCVPLMAASSRIMLGRTTRGSQEPPQHCHTSVAAWLPDLSPSEHV
ncbi:hypothetical protein GDO78_021961 [Eleutherodactylus coqui]|uniref:Uncharacterized protein n=1 Tax=Eleutherodactylus coqui TaxID=57060 RepID=A0A8J6EGZ0_ELECQ|nr:hypothetical protein GDO78_021961 [Eleutherodactylus coqui]